MIEQQASEDKILESAIFYVKQAGRMVEELMKKPLKWKEKVNHSDIVTEVDVRIEEFLCEWILRDYPDHWILSEEASTERNPYDFMEQPPAGYGWIIDPIDGTGNFFYQIPHFSISIGIVKNGIPVFGVVYNPLTEELYSAQSQHGAFLNGVPIQVGNEHEISEALLATGFQATEWKSNSVVVDRISNIVGKSRNIRILGSASLDLCMVASGQLTGFWHDGLFPWDVAAGSIILQEAGGTVTNQEGRPFRLSDHTLVASNQRIHQALLSILID
jgi:myo-inositol-1(or 4)-monophosphatase